MALVQQTRNFHPLPVIGHPEAYYVKHVKMAEQAGDVHAKASHKVGQYITLALDPKKSWEEKFQCFCHALDKYCVPPPHYDDAIKAFYAKLSDLVRRYAGQEALRLVRQENEKYNSRLKTGTSRDALAEEAEVFFPKFLGHFHDCPLWFSNDAWNQIKTIEGQWI